MLNLENSSEPELSQDLFLGGKLRIWQPKKGYRAGIDPVLLAAAVEVTPGETVLELGCGVGVASLCLGRRVPGVVLDGVELQQDYALVARKNAVENAIELTVHIADLCSLPAEIRSRGFDHVIANPPYYNRAKGTPSPDAGRETALADGASLATWVDVATRRLRPKGYMTFIQKADRLPDLLAAMDDKLGSVRVQPLSPRKNRPAELVIVKARKGGRAAFQLLAPLILHDGQTHTEDGDSYSKAAKSILRDGSALTHLV